MEKLVSPVIIKYKYTIDEFKVATQYASMVAMPLLFMLRWPIYFILGSIFLNIPFIHKIIWENTNMLFVLLPLSIALAWLLCRLAWNIQLHNTYSSSPYKNQELEYRIENNLITYMNSLGHGEMNWQAVYKVVHTPKGLLFFLSKNILFWLPRHAFINDLDYQYVISSAKDNNVKFHEI